MHYSEGEIDRLHT